MSERRKLKSSPAPSLNDLARLGKNINGYFGETIDLPAILADCVAAAQAHGWTADEISVTPQLRLLTLIRQAKGGSEHTIRNTQTAAMAAHPSAISDHRPRVYISTGIHGDEPAGPLAVRQLLMEDRWPAHLDVWLCPCLNPAGFLMNRRENAQGADLNRQYLQPTAPETLAHISWLQRQPPFDLCLCLHEDWEAHGFYVYELNPDDRPSLAEAIVSKAAEVCPIDRSELIEGRPAQGGIIRPSVDPRSRPQWPEAFFLLTYKTRLSYTLEAPSDFPLSSRVAALIAGVGAALERIDRRG